MTARVLVVDDIVANQKLLEARLLADYFDVTTVDNGFECIDICKRSECDIVLLDVMMPQMDGFEVCRTLKSDPHTAHIPIVMVTALDQPADRTKGLDAGADDFLTKPVDDLALISRVKSLVRLKMLTEELRMRAQTTEDIYAKEIVSLDNLTGENRGKVFLVDQNKVSSDQILSVLSSEHRVVVEKDPQKALFTLADSDCELVIVNLDLENFDPLRLCSQLRSLERTRMLPILLVGDEDDKHRVLRGLELGVNDFLFRPIDRNEILARARTQVRRKRFTDHLRQSIKETMELAVIDPLTGLHNRRYLETHLQSMVQQVEGRSRVLSVLVLDLDKFKAINDTHGHDAGDDVLKEFANRLKMNVRGIDLCCRFGGEEFVVIMPDTDMHTACQIATRVCEQVAGKPFVTSQNQSSLNVTVSIGVAQFSNNDSPAEFLKRADDALYEAKRSGRNRVVSLAA